VIDRPHLLSVIEQTSYLDPGHPLKRWAHSETIIEQDEFEYCQWPARSIDGLLGLASGIDGDPYLEAVGIALKLTMPGYLSPFPADRTAEDIYATTSESAAKAADPLLQMLVANQASAVTHSLTGSAAFRFDLLCWQLGCRLTDPDPLYLSFYLSELWQHWNSYPRSYALSHLEIPPAKELLQHLAELDGGRFERLRRFLWLKADLELVIADLRTWDTRTGTQGCLHVRAELLALLELLESGGHDPGFLTYTVDPDALWDPCRDLAMAFFYLEQYQFGLELLHLSLSLGDIDGAEDIIGTVGAAISDLGLADDGI
jgi:hypothetical protein